MNYAREPWTPALFTELWPLLELHYAEIAHFKEIPLDPDQELYCKLEQVNSTRMFVARTPEGKVTGYANFFLRPNIHYKNSLQAVQDVLFFHPEYRGRGGHFIKWCDEQLKLESVQVVYQHVKVSHNFGPLLERIGYKLVDLIYARKL